MKMTNIENAIATMKAGKMIILVDDENRENEGDLVVAAEMATPEHINFMAQHGRGLICLAMEQELIAKLNLPPMSTNNKSKFGTNFTVSIEARNGVTTGISAYDRATTIQAALTGIAANIVTPGHIFPLAAKKHGVLTRTGQTEGSVDLARLAGLKPAAVICEIMRDDGQMARMPDLEVFAQKHDLQIVQINDLIKHRLRHDTSIWQRISTTVLPTQCGDFQVMAYETKHDQQTHLALIKGPITANRPTLVRIHSECLTGDVFGSARCDCGEQLHKALQMMQQAEQGVLLYMRQEGRGIGLANKLRAYALQDNGLDTVAANHQLGFADDLRDYGMCAQILQDLGVGKIKLLTNNPEKLAALSDAGFSVVERVPLEVIANQHNANYLHTKKIRMGHLI